MWQKARIVRKYSAIDDIPVGAFFWVKVAPPTIGQFRDHCAAFSTNITHLGFGAAMIRAEVVELLPEFSDNVEMIDWQDFLAGKE